jgi:hypothetical protein
MHPFFIVLGSWLFKRTAIGLHKCGEHRKMNEEREKEGEGVVVGS